MKVTLTVQMRRPRWLIPVWVRRARPLLLVLALVFAGPVLASDRFGDVETGNPHHDDINTIATAGITRGCNPPTNNQYCPGQPVLRQEMASFLQRGLGRGSYMQNSLVTLGLTAAASVAQTDLTVPGAGFVLVNATGMAYQCTGGPCLVTLTLNNEDTAENSASYSEELTTGSFVSLSNTYMFEVASAGIYTFRALMGVQTSASALADASISAVWVPFGSSGGSTLGEGEGDIQQVPSP